MGNFPQILNFLRKYNFKNDHHSRRHKSSNSKVKPDKFNPNTFHEEHNLKANQNKKQGATYMHDFEKFSQSDKEMEEVYKMSYKQVKYHRNHSNNGCFKSLFFNASKTKKLPEPISSFEPQTTHLEGVESKLPKAQSLHKFPSLGKSRNINEQGTKTPNKFTRTPSFNRTPSTGIKQNNGSLNRSTSSIGRSQSDAKMKFRRMNNVSKSGPVIMFSNSSGMLKPPPLEEKLECTLEELYHGCVKHIKVSRRLYTFTGHIKLEDEILTVNVEPGWKTGTKITFKGTVNDERPKEIPGDVIFVVTEKQHPLFRRIDDDLELEMEIPLVDALTGCKLTIPLPGEEKMSLKINEIIYHGQEKIIAGKGMPNQKNPNQMGNLKVKFLVVFPDNLTDEQRSEISRILIE